MNLAALVPGANPELVDLRLGHVGPLLRVIQLVLDFPVLGQVGVGLFLLQSKPREQLSVQSTEGVLTMANQIE